MKSDNLNDEFPMGVVNVGDKFGKWTVISRSEVQKNFVETECVCLSKRLMHQSELLRLRTTQCGKCFREQKKASKLRILGAL